MFEIDPQKSIDSAIPIIASEYVDLLYYDGPILYTGLNSQRFRVIGSSVDENFEAKIERHFRVLVSDADYSKFINQAIAYVDVLKIAESVFVVDYSFDGKSRSMYLIDANEIPVEYLPAPDSFCPATSKASTFKFLVQLNGKLAQLHRVISSELVQLQEGVSKTLLTAAETIQEFFPSDRIGLQIAPYTAGSFQMTYELDVPSNIPFNFENYAEFLDFFLRYELNHFAAEIDELALNDSSMPLHFEALYNKYASLGLASDRSTAAGISLRTKLIEHAGDTAKYLRKIANSIGESFDEIILSDYALNSQDETLGVIDGDFYFVIDSAIEKYDRAFGHTAPDHHEGNYEIAIYSLNIRTRNGKADVVEVDESGDRKLTKFVSFSIDGKSNLAGSVFTDSLSKGKFIAIKALAIRKDSKIEKLHIGE